MMDVIRWLQLITAMVGVVSSAVWFLMERRRVRHVPVMWGLWCGCLIAFRVAVFYFPANYTADQVTILNSISNTLFLLGAIIVSTITIEHIIGAYKHGRIH